MLIGFRIKGLEVLNNFDDTSEFSELAIMTTFTVSIIRKLAWKMGGAV